MNEPTNGPPRTAIFAPTTQLSITLESTAGREELHVHAAGQGFWVARMLTVLGHVPVLCTPIGGETGVALRVLLGDLSTDGFVPCNTTNGSYIHDRRGGDRVELAVVPSEALDRHVVDDLVSVTLACGLGAEVAVVCGTNLDSNIEAQVFERITRDLRAGGTTIVADLAGEELRAALEGGIDLLKVSHQELIDDGWAAGDDRDLIVAAMHDLREAGARDVVVSLASAGSIAAIGPNWYTVLAPELSVVEHRGAGDSMTAALAAGLNTGAGDIELLRLAAAAAALNVTRHGLASGHLQAIEQLIDIVDVSPLDV